MTQLVYDNASELIGWASEIVGLPFRSDAKAVGQRVNGRLNAVVVYDGFSQCDCNMHVASNGTGHWLTRALLSAAFSHPFVQWKMRRVTALVPASNTKAIKLDQHLGFQLEGVCQRALPDDDIVILGMLREHCRFIPKEYRHA